MPFKSKAALVILLSTVLLILGAALIAVRTWQHRGPSEADPATQRVVVRQAP